jgi:hypothetical protein
VTLDVTDVTTNAVVATPLTASPATATLHTPLHTLATTREAARHTFGTGLVHRLQMEDALFASMHAQETLLALDESVAPSRAYFTDPALRERPADSRSLHARLERETRRAL